MNKGIDYGEVKVITLTDSELSDLYQDKIIIEERHFGRQLMTNEYCIVNDSTGRHIGCFKKKGNRFVVIDSSARGKVFNEIGATEENYEQMCFIDAYMDESIDMIILEGNAGTGKSFMALLCGLNEVMGKEGKANHLLYTREIVECGRPIGFLPGELEMKTKPYWKPAEQNIRKILRPRGQSKNSKAPAEFDLFKYVSFEPMQFMRGTTYEHTVMINDEAQNQSLDTVQMFCTRAGIGCKVIVAGSYRQIDDRYLDKDTNGMSIMKGILKGNKSVACIRLTKQERHGLSKLIDEEVEKYRMEHGMQTMEA